MTTRGDRLRSYLLAKTGGQSGWQARLVAASGVKRQTISKYTSPAFDRYPDLETLAALASGLSVETFELVAAMDGLPARCRWPIRRWRRRFEPSWSGR